MAALPVKGQLNINTALTLDLCPVDSNFCDWDLKKLSYVQQFYIKCPETENILIFILKRTSGAPIRAGFEASWTCAKLKARPTEGQITEWTKMFSVWSCNIHARNADPQLQLRPSDEIGLCAPTDSKLAASPPTIQNTGSPLPMAASPLPPLSQGPWFLF